MNQPAVKATAITWRNHVQTSDLEAVRRIIASTGVFNDEEIAVAVELAEDALNNGAASDYHFLFVEIAGQVVAYTCFGRVPFTDERYDLYWIATDPKAQGQGLAIQILQHTEDTIRKLGGKKLYAETSSRAPYAPAHRFYPRCGFTLEATLRGFYRDGDDKLIFVKSL